MLLCKIILRKIILELNFHKDIQTSKMQENQPSLKTQQQEDNPRFIRFQTILKNLRIIFRSSQAHSRWVEKESGLSAAQLWMMWELFNDPGLNI